MHVTLYWGFFSQSSWKVPRLGDRGPTEDHQKKEMNRNQPTGPFIESNSEAYVQVDKQENQNISNSNLIGTPNPIATSQLKGQFRYNPFLMGSICKPDLTTMAPDWFPHFSTARWGPSKQRKIEHVRLF